MIEADGTWHTLDSKFCSVGWISPTANSSAGVSLAELTPPGHQTPEPTVEGSKTPVFGDDEMDLDSGDNDVPTSADDHVSLPPPEDVTEGVTLENRVAGGAYSDVWRGTLQTDTGILQVCGPLRKYDHVVLMSHSFGGRYQTIANVQTP